MINTRNSQKQSEYHLIFISCFFLLLLLLQNRNVIVHLFSHKEIKHIFSLKHKENVNVTGSINVDGKTLQLVLYVRGEGATKQLKYAYHSTAGTLYNIIKLYDVVGLGLGLDICSIAHIQCQQYKFFAFLQRSVGGSCRF